MPWECRRTRRDGRVRRRPNAAALERLEGRELMAYTPLGFSLPDLSVTGFAAPTAAWGHPLAITLDVKNTGSSTLIEPLNLAPTASSTADSQPTTVAILALRHNAGFARPFLIGSINIPSIPQNSLFQTTQVINLPPQPAQFGFPGPGGKIFLEFVVDPNHNIPESDYTNNSSPGGSLKIEAALPSIQAIGLDVPPVLQPGDTIAPSIRIANYGTTNITPANPLTVELVASLTPIFGPGSSILAEYTVTNLPAQALAPNETGALVPTTINPAVNIITINGAPVTLPALPKKYFLGVVTDPSGVIQQLQVVKRFHLRVNPFGLSQQVGPPIKHLPPAGVLVPGGGSNNLPFPNIVPVSSTSTPTPTPTPTPVPPGPGTTLL